MKKTMTLNEVFSELNNLNFKNSLKESINKFLSEDTEYPNLFDITNKIKDDIEYKYDILEPVTREFVGDDMQYRVLVKNVQEAEKFNYQSDYWGSADKYQEDNVYAVQQLEPYIGQVVSINWEDDEPELARIVGVLIDRQYNDMEHTEILVEPVDNIEEALDDKYEVRTVVTTDKPSVPKKEINHNAAIKGRIEYYKSLAADELDAKINSLTDELKALWDKEKELSSKSGHWEYDYEDGKKVGTWITDNDAPNPQLDAVVVNLLEVQDELHAARQAKEEKENLTEDINSDSLFNKVKDYCDNDLKENTLLVIDKIETNKIGGKYPCITYRFKYADEALSLMDAGTKNFLTDISSEYLLEITDWSDTISVDVSFGDQAGGVSFEYDFTEDLDTSELDEVLYSFSDAGIKENINIINNEDWIKDWIE